MDKTKHEQLNRQRKAELNSWTKPHMNDSTHKQRIEIQHMGSSTRENSTPEI